MTSARDLRAATAALIASTIVAACGMRAPGAGKTPSAWEASSATAGTSTSTSTSASTGTSASASGSASASAGASSAAARSPTPRSAAQVKSEWPCPGCSVRLPPTDDARRPAPMLVVLHGDDGNTSWMDWIWHAATDRAGVVLVVLRCPYAGGYGAPRWTVWQKSAEHDPGWLRARVAEVAAREPIDPARLYAAGYSSGATYLSWLTAAQPSLFAAVSLVAGGRKPETGCAASRTPVYMLIGALDTMLAPDVQPLRDWYRACGHEVEWDLREGMTHEGISWVVERGGADKMLAWMLRRSRN